MQKIFSKPINFKINCKGKLLNFNQPLVMGILNITPDSFYENSRVMHLEEIIHKTEKMLNDGASIIDIGGYSSRPGATDISMEEETNRVVPVINALTEKFPDIIISIDTFRSEVAKAAIAAGAAIINDISAGNLDDKMLETVAQLKVPYIMMHMKGTPQNMKSQCEYEDIFDEMILYFSKKINELRKLGVNDIIIDPGFGFAKNLKQNYQVMQNLERFKIFDCPLLVGVSRKSMIYKLLESDAKNALNGTTVLNTIALQKGANILRVHDVKEAKECVEILNIMSVK